MSTIVPIPPLEQAPPAFALRLSLSFVGAFAAVGIMLPYFPVWLKTLSLSDAEIGIMLSLPMFLRIVTTPFVAARADKAGDRANVFLLTTVLTFFATGLFYLADSFWPLLLLVLLQAVVAAPHALLLDAITITGVRRYGVDYARIRLWGSLAFVITNIVGGYLIAQQGGGVVLPLLLVLYALAIAGGLVTPRLGKPRRPSPLADFDVQGASNALRKPDFILLMTSGTLIHASHAMLYGFSAIYWAELGISGTMIGLLWASAVICEVILFQFARPILGRFSITAIVVFCGLLAALRWAAFPFDFGLPWYFALQLLHAGSFAAVHLAQQRLIVERVREDQEAASQGLLFFLNGLTMGTFMILSGYLFGTFGVEAFLAMSLVALAGVACHYTGLIFARRRVAGDALRQRP